MAAKLHVQSLEAAQKGTRRNEKTQGAAQEDTKKTGRDKRTKKPSTGE